MVLLKNDVFGVLKTDDNSDGIREINLSPLVAGATKSSEETACGGRGTVRDSYENKYPT